MIIDKLIALERIDFKKDFIFRDFPSSGCEIFGLFLTKIG
jgi:hypothetical protein